MKTSTDLGIRVSSTSRSGKYNGAVRIYKGMIKVAEVKYNVGNPLKVLQSTVRRSKYLIDLQAQLSQSIKEGLVSIEDFNCVRDEFNLKITHIPQSGDY